MADSHIETIELPGVALHMNTEYFPVLVVSWFGTLGPRLVEDYASWIGRMAERATAEGTRLVLLEDTRGVEGLPGPDTRRAMAMAMEDLSVHHPGVVLGAAPVISNPFMRAVATMVLAISRRKYDVRPAKSIEQAVEHVEDMLDKAGLDRPDGFAVENLQQPERPG